jgi:hypothetical protein
MARVRQRQSGIRHVASGGFVWQFVKIEAQKLAGTEVMERIVVNGSDGDGVGQGRLSASP